MKWDKHQHSNDMGHKWTERVRGAVFEGKKAIDYSNKVVAVYSPTIMLQQS